MLFGMLRFTFIYLADKFNQSDLQMTTVEALKPTKVQHYVSDVTSPS